MKKLTITDLMVVIGVIGILAYFLMLYTLGIPDEGIIGLIWIAWIIISGLLFGFGMLVKVINSRKPPN